MAKKNLTPEQRERAARIVRELRADVRELRTLFERLQRRADAGRS